MSCSIYGIVLHYVGILGMEEMVRLLLEAGANVSAEGGNIMRTLAGPKRLLALEDKPQNRQMPRFSARAGPNCRHKRDRSPSKR